MQLERIYGRDCGAKGLSPSVPRRQIEAVNPLRPMPPSRTKRALLVSNAISWPVTTRESTSTAPRPPSKTNQTHSPLPQPLRKTKIVATIGPTSNTKEMLFKLADAGMNCVRLNMSHGTHDSHQAVIDLVREYNRLDDRSNLALLLDTKGPEVRSGDVAEPLNLSQGDALTLTIQEGPDGAGNRVSVNYDGFVDDIAVGDIVLVDGGLMSMEVKAIKEGTDVLCSVIDGGQLTSRRHLNIRGKSANLPAITERDWADIQFGVQAGVDYFALSFVRDASAILELNAWLRSKGRVRKGKTIAAVIAKIESADSVQNLDDILDAAGGAMVARGDLGAEFPIEEVPFWQEKIVQGCRCRAKPVIVATNMLESMITHAVPTRAEVADIAVAVREGADAVMLSGETAYGAHPLKSLEVMATVAKRTESGILQHSNVRDLNHAQDRGIWNGRVVPTAVASGPVQDVAATEMFEIMASTAAGAADAMQAPLVVFTRRGFMPSLLSHFRPKQQIFAFTDSDDVTRKLALYQGVIAFSTHFSDSAEATFDRALRELKERGFVHGGQLLVLVQSSPKPIWPSASMHAVQVRQVPLDRSYAEGGCMSSGEW